MAILPISVDAAIVWYIWRRDPVAAKCLLGSIVLVVTVIFLVLSYDLRQRRPKEAPPPSRRNTP